MAQDASKAPRRVFGPMTTTEQERERKMVRYHKKADGVLMIEDDGRVRFLTLRERVWRRIRITAYLLFGPIS